MLDILSPAAVGFFVAFFTSIVLVFTKKIHGSLTLDNDEGIQKVHNAPTPRVGGVALALGFFASWFYLRGESQSLLGLIGLVGLPAFLFGLAEDLSKIVGIRTRLFATIASGFLFVIFSGYSVTHIDVWGADMLLAIPFAAIAFSAFAIAGVSNAINLIDGFHGLAAGTSMLILLSFVFVGWRVGDMTIVNLSLVFFAIMAGFFLLNFPFGRLFLGDSGAYFTGYFIATLAIMLPARNPEVSPWVSLLILSYPVTEAIVSIIRRLTTKGTHPGQADNAHLHHIVYKYWTRDVSSYFVVPDIKNALTSVSMWILPLLTLIFVMFSDLQSWNIMVYYAGSILVYFVFYFGLKGKNEIRQRV